VLESRQFRKEAAHSGGNPPLQLESAWARYFLTPAGGLGCAIYIQQLPRGFSPDPRQVQEDKALTSIPRGLTRHGTGTAKGDQFTAPQSGLRPKGLFPAGRCVVAAACLGVALAAPAPALAQHVLLKVNGELITDYDVDQRTKFNMLANHQSPPRTQVIEDLIDDKLKAQYAKRFKIDLTDKDVDQQYADMAKRMHLNADQLTHALNQGGVNATTLKAKILADMSWQYIIRGRFQSSLQVDEKSINTEVESLKKGGADEVGYDYTLRPILFMVPTGNGSMIEARRKDADALRARFMNCESGVPAARAQHDVIIRPPVTKNSADFPAPLREILNKTEIGHLTPPETTTDGVEVYALCDRKETKSETPEKRAAKEKIFASKFDALSKSQLRELRRGAMIERIE
jgi:peptidyl-prolyl cis-trans isomerase SurA